MGLECSRIKAVIKDIIFILLYLGTFLCSLDNIIAEVRLGAARLDV